MSTTMMLFAACCCRLRCAPRMDESILQGAPVPDLCSLQKCPFPWIIWTQTSTCFLGTHESAPQIGLPSVQPFLHSIAVCQTHTERHTDHATSTCDICSSSWRTACQRRFLIMILITRNFKVIWEEAASPRCCRGIQQQHDAVSDRGYRSVENTPIFTAPTVKHIVHINELIRNIELAYRKKSIYGDKKP